MLRRVRNCRCYYYYYCYYMIKYDYNHRCHYTWCVTVYLSLGLASAVSSPSSGSERSPAAKHVTCVLLCLMGLLKQSLFHNSPGKQGDKTHYVPFISKSRVDMSNCPPYDRRPCVYACVSLCRSGALFLSLTP